MLVAFLYSQIMNGRDYEQRLIEQYRYEKEAVLTALSGDGRFVREENAPAGKLCLKRGLTARVAWWWKSCHRQTTLPEFFTARDGLTL